MSIKVYNRSTGVVCYELPELNTRRVFNLGETKILEPAELEALSQTDGGLLLLKNMLMVEDKEWVAAHFEAPIEYWWKPERIRQSMIEDDVELFSETLDYAPDGVIDFIKMFACQIPLTDLNKVEVLKQKTGFDTMGAIAILQSKPEETTERKTTSTRRRREEE